MNFLRRVSERIGKRRPRPAGVELRISWLLHELDTVRRQQEANAVLLGDLLADQRGRSSTVAELSTKEFRVFSQGGEDGILQYLTRTVPIARREFVEFGVEDYREANTRLLVLKDGWRGLVMDPLPENVQRIRESDLGWKHGVDSRCVRVTAENVEQVLGEARVSPDLALLSIDIDGNDYWVWRAIGSFAPRIVVCEYNSLFGEERAVTIPYRADFERARAHYSSVYFGASLRALWLLGKKKGYRLVGVTSNGVNAFFAREDVAASLPERSPAEAYVLTGVREARDESGALTMASGWDRLRPISGLELEDVEFGGRLKVGDLIPDRERDRAGPGAGEERREGGPSSR